jgi:hypothetical protein
MAGGPTGQLSANCIVGTDQHGFLTTAGAFPYPPAGGVIVGTANQIVITAGPPGTDTFSLSPTLVAPGALRWTTGDIPLGMVYTDAAGNLTSVAADSGELLIGADDALPVKATLTGTPNEIIITNAAGSITLSLPQAISPTSDVGFNSLSTNTPASLIKTTAVLTDYSAAAAGTLLNAPSAGDPAKWLAIDDDGTIRKFPTWL